MEFIPNIASRTISVYSNWLESLGIFVLREESIWVFIRNQYARDLYDFELDEVAKEVCRRNMQNLREGVQPELQPM